MKNKFMVVLFNLKQGETDEGFQQWMRENDIPVASSLPSVAEYSLAKTVGMLGAEGEPPYRYMEIIRVTDFEQLGRDAQGEAIQKVAAQFAEKIQDGVFLLSEQVG